MKVILCLYRIWLDFFSLFHKDINKAAFEEFEYLYDTFEIWLFQLFINMLKIIFPVSPILNLVQGPVIFVVLLAILIIDHFLYLIVPMVESLFESVSELLVLLGGLEVFQILVGNIQFGVALVLVGHFGQIGHEFVQLAQKLLLHVLRPHVVFHEMRDKLVVHLIQQGFHILGFYHSGHQTLFQFLRRTHLFLLISHFYNI